MKGTLLKKATLAAVVVSAFSTAPALADTVTMKINGKVTASSCNATINNSAQNLVTLPAVEAGVLNDTTQTVPFTNFTINIDDCPAGTQSYKITFAGDTLTRDAKYYKTSTASTAQNVGIELQGPNGEDLSSGKFLQGSIPQTGADAGKVALTGKARPVKGDGTVTAGDYTADISVTFDYN